MCTLLLLISVIPSYMNMAVQSLSLVLLHKWERIRIAHHRQDLYHGSYQEMMTISITKLIMWCQPSQLMRITYPQPAGALYKDSLLCRAMTCVVWACEG